MPLPLIALAGPAAGAAARAVLPRIGQIAAKAGGPLANGPGGQLAQTVIGALGGGNDKSAGAHGGGSKATSVAATIGSLLPLPGPLGMLKLLR